MHNAAYTSDSFENRLFDFTALPLAGVLVTLYGLKNKIIVGEKQSSLGYLRFQISCIFAEYDLFKPTVSIQKCTYMNFRILTQFYINFSRQDHQI